jgi:hypothetical protein
MHVVLGALDMNNLPLPAVEKFKSATEGYSSRVDSSQLKATITQGPTRILRWLVAMPPNEAKWAAGWGIDKIENNGGSNLTPKVAKKAPKNPNCLMTRPK